MPTRLVGILVSQRKARTRMTKPVITLRGMALAQAVLPLLPSVTRGAKLPPRPGTGAQDNAPAEAAGAARARASGD